MKRIHTIITCDLCQYVDEPKATPKAEAERRKMHELRFSSTDQGGHDEEWTKDICDECRKRIAQI